MYIAFTEEQAQEIRRIGISVIEFKNCIKKGIGCCNICYQQNI